jgi:hypothetical protein
MAKKESDNPEEQGLFSKIAEVGLDIGKKIWDATDPARGEGSLNDFISLVKKNGIAVTSKYAVQVTTPQIMGGARSEQAFGNSSGMSMVSFLCNSVSFPGMSLTGNETIVNNVPYFVPGAVHMDSTTLTFYCDSDMKVKTFFDLWMDAIFNNKGAREFKFRQDYTTKIDMLIYNQQQQVIYKVELFEAFPINVGGMHMSYSGTQPLEFQVQFASTSWKATRLAVDHGRPENYFDKLFGQSSWYPGSILKGMGDFMESTDSFINQADAFLNRIDRLKGMERGLKTQIKSVPGIFKSKVTRIKDLPKGF